MVSSASEIEAEVKLRRLMNVVLLPPVPRSVVQRLVTQADALLVHLRSDPLFSITVPSKVQSYLYAGVPIIAGLTGDARTILERSNGALFFEPGDSDGFRRAAARLFWSWQVPSGSAWGAAGRSITLRS